MGAAIKLEVFDVSSISGSDPEFAGYLELPFEQVKVSDVIRARVEKEVDTCNEKNESFPNMLVQPTETERLLNRSRKPLPTLDLEQQVKRAMRGFESNDYFILINDQQMVSLDQPVIIGATTKVSFFRLVPLQGG